MRNVTLPIIGAAIGTAVAWVVMPWAGALLDDVIPASRWFEVHEIVVEDTKAGQSPAVRVKRDINRAFTGHWTVTLRRETGEGYAVYCARSGRSEYRAGAVAPEGTDLDWWMDVPANPPCPEIQPGQYIVVVAWTLELPGLQNKIVRAESNAFQVKH